ncbi:hypothetical protein NUACC21_76330 [Scytonema sp. NUACC21]
MSLLPDQKNFEALLNYLQEKHHFDVTSYKSSSLRRQISSRMQQVSINDFREYQDYLEVHSEEILPLFNAIEINVTSFFRDRSAWDYISNQIVPQIIASKSLNEPIRVWSAGCAFGQETYTVAMILAESLGLQGFSQQVRIYGTDINQEVLNRARKGSYPSSEVNNIPGSLLNRYFQLTNNCYVFRHDLRHSFVFQCHNMIENPPIPRIDLLICRNALIYFNLKAQTRTLVRFYFSLNENGFLFLGKSEIAPDMHLFTTVNLEHRVFAKVLKAHLTSQLLIEAFKGKFYQKNRGSPTTLT